MWISLGRVLAQPGSYPHEQPLPKSCCTWAPRFVQPAAQTLRRRKPAPAFRKKRLSTERGRLYYYCYLYIELSKNNQNPHSGASQASLHKGRRQRPGEPGAKKREKGFRVAIRSVGVGQDGRVPGAGKCRCLVAQKALIAIIYIAISAYPLRGEGSFDCYFCLAGARCVKLGIVLAQAPGYPQKKATAGFCPRCRDSGSRDRCTELAVG